MTSPQNRDKRESVLAIMLPTSSSARSGMARHARECSAQLRLLYGPALGRVSYIDTEDHRVLIVTRNITPEQAGDLAAAHELGRWLRATGCAIGAECAHVLLNDNLYTVDTKANYSDDQPTRSESGDFNNGK